MTVLLPPEAAEALLAFSTCPSWEQRARLLLQWGERLPLLPAPDCNEHNRVHGCESQVWLDVQQHDGRISARAASDARLLRGLLALLLLRVNGLTPAGLASLDLDDWYRQLGLGRQLTPSRSNGLHAVLQQLTRQAHSQTDGRQATHC